MPDNPPTDSAANPEWLNEEYLQNPHVVHARLREQGPVTEVVIPPGLRAWLITGHAEARAALADPTLAKDLKANLRTYASHLTQKSELGHFRPELITHMLNSDPPEHTRLRMLVNKAFTARRLELMRPSIEKLTAQLLDEAAQHSEVDLLDAFASPLSIMVICEILGVPMNDRDEFRSWSTTLVAAISPEAAEHAAAAMAQYLSELIQHKREHPGDDIFSALVKAEEAGDTLDHAELMSEAFLLLVAGHETTASLIASTVLHLLRNPGQLAALRADPGLIRGVIEEVLRCEGPVNQATVRFTTQPVTIGDVTIPADELVFVSLLAANRDPARYPDPDRFDITRPAGGHLAFGHGIHFCLGAPLARLEGEIAVTALLSRFPGLALAVKPEELTWRNSTLVRGLSALPVNLGLSPGIARSRSFE
jgi:cytochrome P450